MATFQVLMAGVLFLLGAIALLLGLGVILTRDYLDALRSLSRESSHLGAKAAHDAAFLPVMEGASRLVEAVTRMVQTAVGVGAFLCLLGAGLCALAFWMLGQVS